MRAVVISLLAALPLVVVWGYRLVLPGSALLESKAPTQATTYVWIFIEVYEGYSHM